MGKKVLAVLLAGTMCLSLLAGCKKSDNAPSSGQEGTVTEAPKTTEGGVKEEADFSKHLEISAWVHTIDNEDGYLSEPNENPVIAYISEKFNVTFKWQIPPTGSEGEQMNLMLGSGDYTDVFDTAVSPQTGQELYENGVIQDLTPYVEKYMPNYMALVSSNDTIRKSAYTDDGKIIYIPLVPNEAELNWGGLMYNRKILEDMTGGNIQFPSGGEEPATVADWEYMLDLMKQYYEASGRTEYACLILPATGYFVSGDILTGFGASGTFYVDGNGKVQSGILTDGFYNYLVKMKEWYEKGYIYQDFASRNSDPFFFPNTALTYGGAAGIFYGLVEQLYDRMSNPDYGLDVDFRALTAPLDTENNATVLPANSMVSRNQSFDVFSYGWVASTACNEEKLVRWLQICDYLFSEEGSMMKSYGLTKEQAENNKVYEKLGLEEGAYWFDSNGEFTYNPILDPFSSEATVKEGQLRGLRLPGLVNATYNKQKSSEGQKKAHEVWVSNGHSACVPIGATLTVEENATNAPLSTACNDYIASMVPRFIMGTEKLTKESFEAFKQQLINLGLDTSIQITQTAYDRYMAK